MRIQVSIALLALAALSFGQGRFGSASGTAGFGGSAKLSSLPTSMPMRQYNIHMGKGGVTAQAGPFTLYDNTVNYTANYLPGNGGLPLPLDDLHMASGGAINGYSFVYYDPAGNTALTSVEVAFFDNAATDPAPGFGAGLLYDTVLTGLPGDGLWQVNVDLGAGSFAAGPNVWMGVAFGGSFSDSPEAGWVTFDPPVVGSSHDLFYEFTTASYYGPQGNPPLNFGAKVLAATPEPGTVATVLTGLVGLVGLRRRMRA